MADRNTVATTLKHIFICTIIAFSSALADIKLDRVFISGPNLTLTQLWAQVQERSPYQVITAIPESKSLIPVDGLISLNSIKQKSEQVLWTSGARGTIDIIENNVSFNFSRTRPVSILKETFEPKPNLEPQIKSVTTPSQPQLKNLSLTSSEASSSSQTRRRRPFLRPAPKKDRSDAAPLNHPKLDIEVLTPNTAAPDLISSPPKPISAVPRKTNNSALPKRKSYQIKPGDRIEISVWNEDMTRDLVVSPDGTIAYILIGEVMVLNKTFREVEDHISQRLTKFLIEPKVTVIGKSYEGNYVSILGAVEKPGRKIVNSSDRILDVFARAGGLKFIDFGNDQGEVANLKNAYLSRNGNIIDLDFTALLYEGDMTQNLSVEIGDFIYIPSSIGQHVYVTGEVNSPTSLPFRGKPTLLQAITEGRGFNTKALRKRIMLVRGSLQNPEISEFNFYDIISGQKANPFLDPGDIIFVPPTTLTKVERISRQIIPFLDTIIGGRSAKDSIQNW